MGRFEGKTAVITGGTTGIGLATAQLFVAEGARVIVTGRTPATIASAQATLGANATVIHSDAASLTDIDALAQTAKETFGTFDVLFINAGLARFLPFDQTPESVFDEMFDLNAKGPYFTVQKLSPLMNTGGAVVLTTSGANELGMPMISTYGAAKAALRSMARTMSAELLPRGIRVNAVSPGPIDTPIGLKTGMTQEAVEQFATQMAETNPMKRIGTADEVARAVAFLAFDATYTTGAELPVDGGVTQL